MKENRLSIVLVIALTLLLAVLAWLQYAWLGQISDATRERMRTRLQTDTQRFAEDFNREIRGAYFVFQLSPFQVDSDDWLAGNHQAFNTQYRFWQTQTAYPKLIKNFYFVRYDGTAAPVQYNFETSTFQPIEWSVQLRETKNKIQPVANNTQPQIIDNYTLVMPNYTVARRIKNALTNDAANVIIERKASSIEPEVIGYLLIELDEGVVNQMLADLNQRYFPSNNSEARFNISILKKEDSSPIYPKTESSPIITAENSDQSVPLFDLSVGNFTMIVNSKVQTGNMRFQRQTITPTQIIPPPQPPAPSISTETNENGRVKVFVSDDHPKFVVPPEKQGIWLLSVRHAAGSLESFIDHTRRKNLAISFGILLLLGASIFFIFVSSSRAQVLAQRQMDFVSAVSHEFRTPLAVIYSAGENLTDGVIRTEKQIAQYGNLIQREGKKLSAMVEQILEFAGARSGRKRYDLRETDLATVIQAAVDECQSLLSEKDFHVETEIAENLPKVNADSSALSHTIQNLIVNAVKYGGENRWLKVSAKNGDDSIRVSVEDKGIGIAPKDMKNVFTPFYRAKSVVDAQIHGNGLGLSLVKQTVEAHGGKVFVESETGKGSVFTIHLPGNI